jgi:predicted pyridoxine 5'-phosphate oxidase superfamily flavin-nucleotide-binding protein
MGRAFAKIAFTPSVKQAQALYGSRRMNQRLEEADDAQDRLSEVETRFISERDGFYQATVGESGWPYVQFRGGPEGFLQVLDPKTIGFADFRGNVQYLSVGNLGADERVAMILMDYPNRRRLKIWGRARVIHERDDGELLRRLVVPGYPARVERGIVIAVEAFDWNCPQHITPRFTEREVQAAVAPLKEELRILREQLKGVQ